MLYCSALEAFSTGRNLGSLVGAMPSFYGRGAKVGRKSEAALFRLRKFVKYRQNCKAVVSEYSSCCWVETAKLQAKFPNDSVDVLTKTNRCSGKSSL